jgi:hypothetical protein
MASSLYRHGARPVGRGKPRLVELDDDDRI